jgi:hypothetical protein
MAVAGAAVFLVTGDKRDLLGLNLHEGTKIVTVCGVLTLHRQVAMTEHPPPMVAAPGVDDRSFRATSITAYLEAGGTPEHGQETAVHDSSMAPKVDSPLEF